MGFINQMNSVDYQIYESIMGEQLLFLSLLPQIGETEIKKNMIFDLLTSKKVFERDCAIVDIVSDFMVSKDISKEDIFQASKQLTRIAGLGKTLILCVDPDQIDKKFLDMLRGNSDVYFFTEAKMVLGNMLRIINIQRFKMAAGEVSTAIPFKVIPKAGLAIEIASLS
jgi:flagellar protein FlaH